MDITKANPGAITILTLGKLTNLAQAIQLDSNVTKYVKEVVVGGGALRVPGLVTPVAEPGMWWDPHAADMVFTASWKVTMLGLDVIMKDRVSDELLLRIKNKNAKYGPFIYSITRFYSDFLKKNLHINGINDPGSMVILYMIDSSMFKFMKGPVRVVTEGIAIGQTIMPVNDLQIQLDPLTWKGRPIVSAAFEVDVKRFLKYYEAIMLGKQR